MLSQPVIPAMTDRGLPPEAVIPVMTDRGLPPEAKLPAMTYRGPVANVQIPAASQEERASGLLCLFLCRLHCPRADMDDFFYGWHGS